MLWDVRSLTPGALGVEDLVEMLTGAEHAAADSDGVDLAALFDTTSETGIEGMD